MRTILRKLRGLLGVGLTWAAAYTAVFFSLGVIVGILDPDSIDPGESPPRIAGIGAVVGFVSGAVFGLLLSFTEARKTLLQLSLPRMALWGAISAAAWPLVLPVSNSMVIILCPIGAPDAPMIDRPHVVATAPSCAYGRGGAGAGPLTLAVEGRMLKGPEVTL